MKMLWKIIRALIKNEELKVNVKVELGLLDVLFIVLVIVSVVWMIIAL